MESLSPLFPKTTFERYAFSRAHVKFLMTEVDRLKKELASAKKVNYAQDHLDMKRAVANQRAIHNRLRKNWKSEILRLRKLVAEQATTIVSLQKK